MKLLRSAGFSVSTCVMYLAIPLLGWGLGDLRGFVSMSPRLAYALTVLGLGLAVGWQAYRSAEGIRGGRGLESSRVARQSIVRIVVVLMLYLGLLAVPFADRRGIAPLASSPMLRWAGVVLFAGGMALVFWSGVALGRLYSGDVTLQEGHRLITDGPYRFLRHRRYAGGILLGFGVSMVFSSWIGVIAAVGFVGVLFRIRDEEALMAREFGREWEENCRRTRRLIPLLY